ncbi:hypothetical protein Q4610_02125 [Sphingobium sp. HBC34]|uniref:Uncharacterized protein n=1 Tax=Sphingobium cyanobacteriorum TaxID=3063954 RepID=A0ABT8ZH17_9SPHN|nr:hypothetical protein [Sphingobium sp. HBC34]MDO7833832.1 hypothetical protein [Sphingobium sp. HBC34]
MALPSLFQYLVEKDRWVVIREFEQGMYRDYVIANHAMQFHHSIAKDTDWTSFVRTAGSKGGGFGRLADPCNLAKRMGHHTDDPFEAFQVISAMPEIALRELSAWRLRKLIVEPLLLIPSLPFLILAVLPWIREPSLQVVGWWADGPVKRLID